jgi:hypothetical protein
LLSGADYTSARRRFGKSFSTAPVRHGFDLAAQAEMF